MHTVHMDGRWRHYSNSCTVITGFCLDGRQWVFIFCILHAYRELATAAITFTFPGAPTRTYSFFLFI